MSLFPSLRLVAHMQVGSVSTFSLWSAVMAERAVLPVCELFFGGETPALGTHVEWMRTPIVRGWANASVRELLAKLTVAVD